MAGGPHKSMNHQPPASTPPATGNPSAWAVIDDRSLPGDRQTRSVGALEDLQHDPLEAASLASRHTIGDMAPPGPQQAHSSLQDRLAAQALSTTLDVLKFAGGVTLSTTGKLVAPPLHVTRTILWPSLLAALADWIQSSTPQRIKDWFRILSSSIRHVFTVIGDTPAGQDFLHQFLATLSDLVDSLASDTSRQVLMDGMSLGVRVAEVLASDETKAVIDQAAVLACRLVDAAASGRTKQVIHSGKSLVWSACQLLGDEETTLAWAEVTAYLCIALEMEAAKAYDNNGPSQRSRAARDVRQRQTYDTRLTSDPTATVEQVILSSLGVENDMDHDSVPSKIVVDALDLDADSSVRHQVNGDEPCWTERARMEVDKQLLRDKIVGRARERNRSTQNEDEVTEEEDVEELGVPVTVEDDNNEVPVGIKVPKVALQVASSQGSVPDEVTVEDDESSTKRRVGEQPTDHFFRILNDMLAQKRGESLQWILQHQSERERLPGKVTKTAKATEPRHTSLKQLMASVRDEINERESKRPPVKLGKKQTKILSAVLASLALSALVFGAFGCYGIYVFFRPPTATHAQASRSLLTSSSPSPSSQEIIIRVVREVVHTDPKGNWLGKGGVESSIVDEKGIDKLTRCIVGEL